MLTHITIGTNHLPQAIDFYSHVLATPGIQLAVVKRDPGRAIYKVADSNARTAFRVYSPFNGEAASVGNGTMVSFEA
jgi:catechol 2,3-dioxygenase-like lactoylglutathione lyase family enzyme